MKKIKLTLVIALCSIVFNKVSSQILWVPKDYTTIQSAIDNSHKGDTVLVDEGTYYENISFKGKGIVVASKYLLTGNPDYILKTIINGSKPAHPDSGSCVRFMSAEDSTAVLEGFTLTGGTGTSYTFSGTSKYREGGCIILDHSKAVVKNNLIINNEAKVVTGVNGGGGGGISTMYGNPRILNNVIMNNTASYAAGLVLNWSGGIVKNNIIYHNYGGSSSGTGGIMIWKNEPAPIAPKIVENNTIVGNISYKDAGGLSVKTTNPVIINNIIWGNRQVTGSQITGATSQMMTYCNTQESFAGEGNIQSFPLFSPDTFTLVPGSSCIDGGNSNVIYNDMENPSKVGTALFPSSGSTRNDMGAFGGPGATILAAINLEDIIISATKLDFGNDTIGKSKKQSLGISNLGTHRLKIDSIIFEQSSLKIVKNVSELRPIETDTIKIEWIPIAEGNLNDTVKIYHSFKTIENPKKISISGNGVANPFTLINTNSSFKDDIMISPNPLTTTSHVRYSVNNKSLTSLYLLDASGKQLLCLFNEIRDKGEYTYLLNRQGLENGLYFLQFTSSKKITSVKLLIQ